MPQKFARNAIVLGLLSAVGPFAIDMYLPVLPSIAADLNASDAATQGSILAFFLAVACCQIIYGPISDSYGRKAPLYFGMGLYVLGAIGCSLAPSIEWLIAARFLQGVGACAGMTIPRAIVRDLHTGPDAARLQALIMLVFSVSPILAPLFGSAIATVGSWRLIFDFITLFGVLGILVNFFFLEETRPREKRVPIHPKSVAEGYLTLIGDRHFVGIALAGGIAQASFFTYLTTSSFVFIDHFHFTPTQYSLAFSVNAIAFIGMAQLAARLGRRFGLKRVMLRALGYYVVTTGIVLVTLLAGLDNPLALIAMLFACFGSMGLVMPSTAVIALENYGPRAGTASALLGTIQLVAAVSVVGIVGALNNGTPLAMVAAIFCCAAAAFAVGLTVLRQKAAPQPAE